MYRYDQSHFTLASRLWVALFGLNGTYFLEYHRHFWYRQYPFFETVSSMLTLLFSIVDFFLLELSTKATKKSNLFIFSALPWKIIAVNFAVYDIIIAQPTRF